MLSAHCRPLIPREFIQILEFLSIPKGRVLKISEILNQYYSVLKDVERMVFTKMLVFLNSIWIIISVVTMFML